MRIKYSSPHINDRFDVIFKGYVSRVFPHAKVTVDQGDFYFKIDDIDNLRYFKRVRKVVIALIEMSEYISKIDGERNEEL